jgi:multidrug resistance efflux pump
MLRRLVISVLLLALGAAGLVTLARSRPQPQPLAVQEKVWPVSVQTVRKARVSPTITLYARIDSPHVATLTAGITADVMEVLALEGSHASDADVLVRLDAREARLEASMREAEVKEIQAELQREAVTHDNDRRALELERRLLTLIQRDVQRARELASREVGSASRLDEARQAEARQMLSVDSRQMRITEHASRKAALEARVQRARAQLSRMLLDVERATVTAPFSGPVASVFVSPGDRVRSGDRLLSMYDDSHLEFRAQVPTRYLATLRGGLAAGAPVTATARIDDIPVSATLDRLGAEVERGRGGADALFRITEARGAAVTLGRTVELVVPLPAMTGVIALPFEALYGTDRVYLLEDGRMRGLGVERVGERALASGERQVLVRSESIADGASLIVTQLPNAVDGLKVRVAETR